MSTTHLPEQVLDPFVDCLTPEAARTVVALRADPEIQTRLDQLADRANEGTLAPDERADHALVRGQVGTVVEILEPGVFEVEFSDDQGQTYAMLPLAADELIVLHPAPVQTA